MCKRDEIKTAIQAVFDEHPNINSIHTYALFSLIVPRLKITDPDTYSAYMLEFREMTKDPSSGISLVKGRNGGVMRPGTMCACGVVAKHCAHHGQAAAPIQRQAPSMVASNAAINDHTCTSCGNNRCSKTEKSCWKCGSPIQVQR